MALTKISTGGVKDDAVGQNQLADNSVVLANLTNDCVDGSKIADEAIAESRLEISNAGTNGQFLQKQSGNTGGLTWASAITAIADDSITQAMVADDAIGQDQLAQNAVVADNLTADCVTSVKIADGAVTEYRIADNEITEPKLKISNAGTNGQYLQKQSGNTGGLTWADVSSFWTTLHQGSYTFDSTSDSETITGLGNYDMLKIYMMVNATGSSLNMPFPRITIGTASGMENDNYQSETRHGTQQGGAGGQAGYWPHTQPNNFGDPGGDYAAGIFTCEMFIANWQGTTYHTIGHFSGGYTSGTNSRLKDYSGSVAHRNKINYDRIALAFADASANNTANLKITIQGATYS